MGMFNDFELNLLSVVLFDCRITYSMGDVFLQPMMEQLNKVRGPVSTIFGMLPAVTLATGNEKFEIDFNANKKYI